MLKENFIGESKKRGLNVDIMEGVIIFFQRILMRKSDKRKKVLI